MILILYFSANIIFSDSLPKEGDLFNSLRAFHQADAQAKVLEYKPVIKKKWLDWLPNVGISYTLIQDKNGEYTSQPRPTVGYSFGQIAHNIEAKEQRNAKILQILRGSELAFKTDSFSLVEKIRQHSIYNRSLVYLESIQINQDSAFIVEKRRNEKGLILPVDWFRIQSENIRNKQPLITRKEEIELIEIQIFKLAKY